MAVKRRKMPYPCIGYCIIDTRGYCVGCGRPPTLGMPETCAINSADANEQLSVPMQRDSESARKGK
jgi:predicted Fe-S protein YdhL (DUF1289 family)